MRRCVAGLAVFVALLSACDSGGGGGRGGALLPPPHDPPPAARLSFGWSPYSATAGQPFSVDVLVLDAYGVLVSAPVEVTLTASAGTLGGTTVRVSSDGIARFTDLVLTRAGSTTLRASAPGIAAVETTAFIVAPGSAASLAFEAQPPATTTAGAMLPEVKVSAYDAYGNIASNEYLYVTLSVAGAQLFGTTTRQLVSGVATFGDLSIRTTGTRYALFATGGSLPPVRSTPFDVSPGPAARLEFGVQPSSTVAGDIITPPVEVRVQDDFGNLVPDAREVTLSGTTLSGTLRATALGGVATFADLSVTSARTQKLYANTPGLLAPLPGGTPSAEFFVTPAAPVSLLFSLQPTSWVVAGAVIPTVTVAVSDAYGNPCTNRSDVVRLSLEGADLFGIITSTLFGGAAGFPGLSVRKAGAGYRLSAQGAGLGPVESTEFVVSPAAEHHLAFTTQPPSTAAAGATLAPSIAVATFDVYGNVATNAYGNVILSLSSPVLGGLLFGTTTRPVVAGTATFGDLSLRKAAAGYRLVATRAYIVPAVTSDPFTILPADGARLAFVVQPSSIRSGQEIAPAVQVAIADEWLNLVTTTDRDVTLALEANSEGAVLAGTTTAATTAGVATFAGLTVREPAKGYRVRASAPGLPDAVSLTFDVSANWLSIGPDGGDVTALATDPAASDVAYAATNGCVWKTTSGGSSWARACRGLPFPMQIDALVVHPSSSEKLFAAGSGGLYRSDDAAGSWSVVASLGGAAPYRTLAIAVAASGAIYAGTFQDGLWRSDDGGATWKRLTAGLPANRITAVAVEPASTEVIYAAGVDPTGVGTVYRSTNRGDTWNETALGPAAFGGVKPTALLVDPSSADVIFVGTESGVYESYDRGASFTQGLAGVDVRGIAAHGPLHMRYAAGVTGLWRKVGFDPWAASTALPSSPQTIAVAMRANGTALAGTRYGVYDRTPTATTWSSRTTGLRALNVTAVGAGRRNGTTYVYAASLGGGVHRSLDGGATWTRGNHPAERQMFYAIAVDRANALNAWLAGERGLYRTTDAGVNWSEVFPSQGTIYSTLLDPSSDAIVYAGGVSDVYRSPNGGGSFRDLNVCSGPMRAMALSAAAPLALWVGQDAGLCKVDLAGVNEIYVPYALQPGTSGSVDAIAVDPDPALAGSTVWASTSDGFHTTLDGGATWTRTSDRFSALLAQPGRLFGARPGGPLEVSRDGGATFAPAGVGLYHGDVRVIADVPWVPNEIYLGTSWGSIFKTTNGGE